MVAIAVSISQAEFYRRFIMGRQTVDPAAHGVNMELDEFTDALADEFNTRFRGQMTLDELLLHPREALAFCDDLRRSRGWFYLPDDIILRSLMRRRKNPNA